MSGACGDVESDEAEGDGDRAGVQADGGDLSHGGVGIAGGVREDGCSRCYPMSASVRRCGVYCVLRTA